jgi:hypothetical protein
MEGQDRNQKLVLVLIGILIQIGVRKEGGFLKMLNKDFSQRK